MCRLIPQNPSVIIPVFHVVFFPLLFWNCALMCRMLIFSSSFLSFLPVFFHSFPWHVLFRTSFHLFLIHSLVGVFVFPPVFVSLCCLLLCCYPAHVITNLFSSVSACSPLVYFCFLSIMFSLICTCFCLHFVKASCGYFVFSQRVSLIKNKISCFVFFFVLFCFVFLYHPAFVP